MLRGKLASLGVLAAAAVLGVSVPACAQPSLRFTPFGDSRGAANPPVARYMAGEGKSFIFDRSPDSSEALLKFDDNPEVWALEPSPGPGGVTIYRNDAGDPVVRVTRLGGVTLYTPREPDGVPAALFGDAGDILLPPFLPTGLLFQRSIPQASDRCSQAAQHLVTVEANNMTPATSPLFLDAITITTDAIVKLARRKEAKTFLTRLEKVMFITGTKPDVSFNKTVMTITIAPSKGYAGRPSSDRITKVAIKH